MFINPKYAIEQGWVTGIKDPAKQIQPNAIDFDIASLSMINELTPFVISEQAKKMRSLTPVSPVNWLEDQPTEMYWQLMPHASYDFSSNVYVEVPEGVAALLIIRSTFNRNGSFLTSGLYDSGFKGHVAGVIHNNSGVMYVAPETRIGQIIFVKSENAGVYAGGYNHEKNTHWAERN